MFRILQTSEISVFNEINVFDIKYFILFLNKIKYLTF